MRMYKPGQTRTPTFGGLQEARTSVHVHLAGAGSSCGIRESQEADTNESRQTRHMLRVRVGHLPLRWVR